MPIVLIMSAKGCWHQLTWWSENPDLGHPNFSCQDLGHAMNEAEMSAELERLRAENAKLKSKDSAGLSLKVSQS
jgi:hypothetical protein